MKNGPLRVGIGGPVGSGKTTLTEKLCKSMRGKYSVAAITNEKKTEGASYELKIAPVVDASTISGYAWSTGKGPPQKFSGAVPVEIAVEVGERTPMRQFLAFVMGMFGT